MSNFSLKISGIERFSQLLESSFSISDDLGSNRTCEFDLIDLTDSLHFQLGEAVVVMNDQKKIFAGTIDEIEEQVPLGAEAPKKGYQVAPASLIIHVICTDYAQLCDKHIVTHRFDVPFQTLGDVVTAIVNTYSGDTGETLANEGITSSGVETGPVLGIITFNYQPVTDCFNDLRDLTGFSWYVDFDKVLHFFDVGKFIAPVELDDTKWKDKRYAITKVHRSRADYRNLQVLRAGFDTILVNNPPDKFTGDGKNNAWQLRLEFQNTDTYPKPIFRLNGVNANDATVQVTGNQSATWLYEVGSQSITRNSTLAALTSSDTLEVFYSGRFPMVTEGRDETEIASRKTIEGGTGVYVNVEQDDKVNDRGLSEDRVAGLLRRFGRIPDFIEFDSQGQAFQAGQLMQVNQPDYGLKGQFQIDSVSISMIGFNEDLQYSVRVVEDFFTGSWVDYYRRLSKAGRPFTIRDNEQIHVLRQTKDTVYISDDVDKVFNIPYLAFDQDTNTFMTFGRFHLGVVKDDGKLVGPAFGQLTIP